MTAGRLLVIGGDAAGMSAASYVNRALPDVDVSVIERSPYTSYSMCGIPHLLSGVLDEPGDLVVRSPDRHREAGITVHTRTEALTIDADARTVRVRDLDAGREREEPYDVLLYAAGAHPVVPPVPGGDLCDVVHTLEEAVRMRARLDEEAGTVRSAVVVGTGYIGLELAEALATRGVQATLVGRNTQVMRPLDADMALLVEQALDRHGVDVVLGAAVEEIRGEGVGARQVVTGRGVYDADLVIVAAGARPNVDVARTAGCALGPTGALVVDPTMRTSVDGIWAAGDCVESTHLVSGQAVNVQLGTHANKQGKIAGLQLAAALAGEEPPARAVFPGVVGTAVTKVCDTEVARTGLSVAEAETAGFEHAAVRFTGTSRAGYLPDAGEVTVKMVAEARSGRLLGAQMVGTGNVAKRIDTAATWCHLGVPVQDAQLMDLAYAPPFGGVWDLLQVGARKLVRELGLSPQL